jgi:hypothetical protein
MMTPLKMKPVALILAFFNLPPITLETLTLVLGNGTGITPNAQLKEETAPL